MNTELICIREHNHPKIPSHLLKQEFGFESIVDPESGLLVASGTSVFMQGTSEEIRAWVEKAGGKVWSSQNPMLGHWKLLSL